MWTPVQIRTPPPIFIDMNEAELRSVIREMIDEVIGASRRCTNRVLESFGICSDDPVMNLIQLTSKLKKGSFTTYEYVQYPAISLDINADQNDREKLLWHAKGGSSLPFNNVPVQQASTVRRIVSFLKDGKHYGSYILSVPSHVLVIHYYGGKMFIVDNEGKFVSRRRPNFIYYVDNAKSVAMQYFKDNKDSEFVKVL